MALDGTGFHPASWRDPSARPTRALRRPRTGPTSPAPPSGACSTSSRSRTPSGCSRRARRAPTTAPTRCGAGSTPLLDRLARGPAHRSTSASCRRWSPPTPSPSTWRRPSPRSTTSAAAGPGGGPSSRRGRRGRPRRPPSFPDGRPSDPAVAAAVEELFDEAADAVEVVRRLWDSWEDDAVIRDAPTGRFVDRDKLHYIDFEGRFFRVKGPSIVPRPPQGNPLVVALAHSRVPFEFAARAADVVLVTPADRADVDRWVADVRDAERRRRARAAAAAALRRGRGVPRRRCRPCRRAQGAPRRPRRPRRCAPTRPSSSARPAALAAQLVAWQAAWPRRVPAAARRDRPRPRRHRRRGRAGAAGARAPSGRATTTACCASGWACVARTAATPTPEGRDDDAQAGDPRRLLPRREQHDGVERPRVQEPDRVRVVRPPGQDGRAGQARLLLPRRGTAAARAARQDPRPRHGGPPGHAADPRRPGRHHHPPRPGRHPQRHLPRALRAGPPAGHARPAVERPGGVERGDVVGRLHR